MKAILLWLALAIIAAPECHAQGSIVFANSPATRVFVETGPGTTTFVPVGSQFTLELMFAPDGTPSGLFHSVAVRVGATTTFGPVIGIFNGGGRTVNAVTPPGGWALLQVRAWETAGGDDYRSAVATGDPSVRVGTSAILRADMENPILTGGLAFGGPTTLVSAGLTSFTLTPVPEPSTIALGLLGTGAWLILRRSAKRLGVLRN